MPGVYIAALVAGAVALAAALPLLFLVGARRTAWLMALLLALQLPMCAIAFEFVRVPLDGWMKTAVADSGLYAFLTVLYAPVTEELAKIWPLALPFVWRQIASVAPGRIALALGVGFALGEIAFLAERLARNAQLAALPVEMFGGFMIERMLVCVWHPAFVALPVFLAARRPALLPLGLLGAMILHFIGNFPIYLSAIGAFGIERGQWPMVLLAWTVLYTIVLALLLAFLWRRGRVRVDGAGRRA